MESWEYIGKTNEWSRMSKILDNGDNFLFGRDN